MVDGNLPTSDTLGRAHEALKKTRDTLAAFRANKINVIVSTSVLEEGMDVKQCNLVIRFSLPENFRSYVQSKGRARAKPSRFVMLTSKAEEREAIWTYRKMEERAVRLCHSLPKLEDEPFEDEDEARVRYYYANPGDPLNSASTTNLDAISLVVRYVQSIPVDRFTTLEPAWEVEPQGRIRFLHGKTN